jgi:hypothetical protein
MASGNLGDSELFQSRSEGQRANDDRIEAAQTSVVPLEGTTAERRADRSG